MLPFEEFAKFQLRDVAMWTESKDKGAITFNGNHISHTYRVSKRGKTESLKKYAARAKTFRAMIPRGSDRTFRMALAMESLTRKGYTKLAAATFIRDYLREVPLITQRRQQMLAKFGIPYNIVPEKVGI